MYCDIIILTSICLFFGKRIYFRNEVASNFYLNLLIMYFIFSDNLVEEAIGGASVAKSFKESDEAGFNDSEVIHCLSLI